MASTRAYILHTRAWRETSLLVDVLSQDFGRIALIAKGAKRPHSPLRGLLEPFTPVSIQFSGKLGVKNLTHAHWVQALNPIHPEHAMHGWYLSELCLRTLGEDDPVPTVYAAYDAAMQALLAMPTGATAPIGGAGAAHAPQLQWVLRQFEYRLLSALGLWPDNRTGSDGCPLTLDAHYSLDEATGWQKLESWSELHPAPWALSGAVIQGLAQAGTVLTNADDTHPAWQSSAALLALRQAMRAMLALALHGKVLSTREVWKQLDAIHLA